ncbi:MAG: glutamate--cysteine ligase [Myxococcota bacterium]
MTGDAFRQRLDASIVALRELLAREGFGSGAPSIGAELEMCIVGPRGHARGINEEIRAAVHDRRVTLEVNNFNLELNTDPQNFTGRVFFALGEQMFDVLSKLEREAEKRDSHIVTIGILPTLVEEDLDSHSMTHAHRYEALSHGLREIRGKPFHIRISGKDVVELASEDITLEGANTALQIHLKVDPSRFGDVYDAANLAIAPVLAVSANSPLLLGCDLWSETRIPLFEQSVDVRHGAAHGSPGRCSLGMDWVRGGPDVLFQEAVEHYPPLLRELGEEDPVAVVRNGGVPSLSELRLHQSTVWRWNRAVYDPVGDGHCRIEMRALPAGPSMVDMMANLAFLLGLTLGLENEMERIRESLDFEQVSHNFYSAAQYGATASLAWPGLVGIERLEASELVQRLVPVAMRGLISCNVDPEEAEELLAVISERAARKRTGAFWQRETLRVYSERMSRPDALREMLLRYVEYAASGYPVAEWPIADAPWGDSGVARVDIWNSISPK